MMEHVLEDSISLLARTPATLDALLRGLPETWTMRNEGDNTWTVFDVIGHLIDGERVNWMPRARSILQFGVSRTFAPFDRDGHVREGHGRTLATLLDEFAIVRSRSLDELKGLNLAPEDLAHHGTHPIFGRVALSELLATWTVHDMTHLHQISRIMAHQYREAVGPWSQYLGVLQCGGHSS